MEPKPEKKIVLLDDTLWKSVVCDLTSISVLLAAVGVGVLVGSTALQWIGGILFILWIFARVGAAHKEGTMTVSQAKEYLQKFDTD